MCAPFLICTSVAVHLSCCRPRRPYRSSLSSSLLFFFLPRLFQLVLQRDLHAWATFTAAKTLHQETFLPCRRITCVPWDGKNQQIWGPPGRGGGGSPRGRPVVQVCHAALWSALAALFLGSNHLLFPLSCTQSHYLAEHFGLFHPSCSQSDQQLKLTSNRVNNSSARAPMTIEPISQSKLSSLSMYIWLTASDAEPLCRRCLPHLMSFTCVVHHSIESMFRDFRNTARSVGTTSRCWLHNDPGGSPKTPLCRRANSWNL